jgi:hypothetical protein
MHGTIISGTEISRCNSHRSDRVPTMSRSLHKESPINTNNFVSHIACFHHPEHRLCNLRGISQPTDWDLCAGINFCRSVLPIRGKEKACRHLLLASSALAPGSMAVSWIRAGAIPFTVMPVVAYALASQCTRPCKADFDDLAKLLALG